MIQFHSVNPRFSNHYFHAFFVDAVFSQKVRSIQGPKCFLDRSAKRCTKSRPGENMKNLS